MKKLRPCKLMYSIKTYLIKKFKNENFGLKKKNKRYCYTKGGGGEVEKEKDPMLILDLNP